MDLILIIAIVSIAFLLLYFCKDLDKEHFLLRLLSIIFVIILLIIIGKAAVDPICEIQLTNTYEIYQYGDNYTGYHWDYTSPSPSVNDVNLFHRNITNTYELVCKDKPQTTAIILLQLVYGFVALFFMYIIIYMTKKILEFKGIIKKGERGFVRNAKR